MQLEVGKIYEGKVTGITKFGAFVELDKDTTGMVHISEVANTFVNEIKDHLTEGTVTNTGKRDGAEVVQLYIRDLVGSITRPVKELKGFEKIFLKAGESKTVTFKITPELLRFYDYDLKQVAEPGDFDVMIGGDSRNVRSARLTLK